MARAQAQVKAHEERKRRRLALALAGALMLLGSGAVAAGWWYQHQQAQAALEQAERDTEKALQALRQKQAAGEVKDALGEAARLRQRALTLLDNPESWKATLDAAASAVKRAKALLQQEAGLAGTTLARQVEDVAMSLAEAEKDHRLWTAFEQVRFKLYDYDPRYTRREAYQEVRRALAQWGLPLAGMPAVQATALLRRRPPPMQERLATLLHFCFDLSWDPAEAKRLLQWLGEVLAAADPDPWRQQVRQAVAQADAGLLVQLVERVDVA
jgi:hypothetical protein